MGGVDDPAAWGALLAGVLIIAMLYSSVGHGGASGYLALLVLAGFARPHVTPVVLGLNLLVAGLGFAMYARRGYFVSRLLVPFLVTSIPGTYLGATVGLSERAYAMVLGAALLTASLRFFLTPRVLAPHTISTPILWLVAAPVGFALGGVAGMVGIGGGIFLSPLLLLMGWADAKQTAAVSAAFIVVNSLTGLLTHVARGAVLDVALWGALASAALLGGALGAYAGASRFSLLTLQRVLGVVLGLAGIKLIGSL